MRIIIKGQHYEIDQNLRSYIKEKILKYQPIIQEPAIFEVTLADLRGTKGGKDKTVCISATLPEEKNPIYVEETTSDFIGSIDLVQERLEHLLLKYKEKKKIGSRYPTKYREAKIEEEKANEL